MRLLGRVLILLLLLYGESRGFSGDASPHSLDEPPPSATPRSDLPPPVNPEREPLLPSPPGSGPLAGPAMPQPAEPAAPLSSSASRL
jgi:hypothetical protein